MNFESQDRHYRPNPLRPRIEDRTGAYDGVSIKPAFAITDNQVFSMQFERDKVEANQRYQRAVYYLIGGTYLYRYGAPWELTEQPWFTAVGLTRTWRDYRTADFLVDPFQRQHERQWDATLSETVGLTESVALVLQLQHTIDNSNIPNYSYKNFTGLAAVSVQF